MTRKPWDVAVQLCSNPRSRKAKSSDAVLNAILDDVAKYVRRRFNRELTRRGAADELGPMEDES